MPDLTPTQEEWRETGIRHIQVSSHGRIKDTWTNSIRSCQVGKDGRLMIQIRHALHQDRSYTVPVAKLVLIAFVGHPSDPTEATPLHIDKDLLNCHVDNLQWAPQYRAKRHHRS